MNILPALMPAFDPSDTMALKKAEQVHTRKLLGCRCKYDGEERSPELGRSEKFGDGNCRNLFLARYINLAA